MSGLKLKYLNVTDARTQPPKMAKQPETPIISVNAGVNLHTKIPTVFDRI